MRSGSTSMPRNAAPVMVAASGCAPPMPPMPPETISLPARSPPKCFSPAAENVSNVPLHNALGADVNPRTRRHLPIHRQTGALQFVKLLPVRPMADEIRICNEHARRMIVRLEHAHRLARLHQQSLVVLQLLQSCDDGVVRLPTPRRPTGSAVHNKVLRTLGNFLVEVVHEHAHGGFLLPAFASDRVAAGRANRGVSLGFRFEIGRASCRERV